MPNKSGKKFGALKIIAIIVVVLVIGLIVLPFIIDVNQFKPELEARLSSALGRQVQAGTLSLSILSGSVGVEDISIADDPRFGSDFFLKAKSLKVGVELTPLIFSKKIKITEISLDSPSINLICSAAGLWNFSSLGAGGSAPPQSGADSKTENPSGGISGDAIALQRPNNADERIQIDRGKEDQKPSLYSGVNLTAKTEDPSGGISGDAIAIKQLSITNGRITIDRGKRGLKPSVYSGVKLSAKNISFASKFPFTLSAILPGNGELSLEGNAGPVGRPDLAATPLDANIKVTRFNLVESGFVSPEAGLSGIVDFEGRLVSDGKKVESQGNAQAENLQVVQGGMPAKQPASIDYAVNYNLSSERGVLDRAAIHYGKAVANLNGNFHRNGKDIVVNMKLRGTDMPVDDIQSLLPAFGVILPKGASLQGGVINTDVTAEGPTDALIIAGSSDLANSRLVGFDLAGKLAAVSNLTGVKPDPETLIETLASNVRVTGQGTQVSGLRLILPSIGELYGDGVVSPEQDLDFKMRALVKTSGGAGGALSQLMGGSGGNVTIPFFVRGTASDPKFLPDVKGATRGILESQLSGKKSQDGESSGTGNAIGNAIKSLLGN